MASKQFTGTKHFGDGNIVTISPHPTENRMVTVWTKGTPTALYQFGQRFRKLSVGDKYMLAISILLIIEAVLSVVSWLSNSR